MRRDGHAVQDVVVFYWSGDHRADVLGQIKPESLKPSTFLIEGGHSESWYGIYEGGEYVVWSLKVTQGPWDIFKKCANADNQRTGRL